MPTLRAVTAYHPTLGSTKGRPISPEHQRRIEEIVSSDRVEFIMEPDPEKRMKALEEADFLLTKNAPLPEDLFRRAGRLRLINVGTEYGEKVDAEAAAEHGVAVAFFDRPSHELGRRSFDGPASQPGAEHARGLAHGP